jgi:hypothetical protein
MVWYLVTILLISLALLGIVGTNLFLFEASRRLSTVELILPSAPSTTVSQLLWISSHAALLRFVPPFVSPPLAADPAALLMEPADRVTWLEEARGAPISLSEISSAM